jgi:hypothetical protein
MNPSVGAARFCWALDKITFLRSAGIFNAESKSVHQSLSRLLVSPVNDAIKSLARDAHAFCRILMIKPFTIRQPHRFQFVGSQGDLLDLA